MSVYARFKREPEGLRHLVELLETTPIARRQRMIDVGMSEDPDYTRKALRYVMTFEDILGLPDVELAEVLAVAPTRMTGFAVSQSPPDVQARFLRNALPTVAAQIRDAMEVKIGLREIGAAQLKIVETARTLERKGLVRAKVIPLAA